MDKIEYGEAPATSPEKHLAQCVVIRGVLDYLDYLYAETGQQKYACGSNDYWRAQAYQWLINDEADTEESSFKSWCARADIQAEDLRRKMFSLKDIPADKRKALLDNLRTRCRLKLYPKQVPPAR